jgi:hypothetical protein
LYIEYIGDYETEFYKKYFYGFLGHAKFGKLPIIQRNNFTSEVKAVLQQVERLYSENIRAYPHRWALWVNWEVYQRANKEWMKVSSTIAPKRKMFAALDEAENWVMDMPPPEMKFENELKKMTESGLLRIVNFQKAWREISRGGGQISAGDL